MSVEGRRGHGIVFCLAVLVACTALADNPPQIAQPVDEVVVIGVTPVPGLNIDADKVPGNVQTLRSADLKLNGNTSLTNALDARLGSVNINDTLADPFQPDILFRGFEASPVLGTPQGMAVYQNGVRINEAFGDTVNWDLIPDIAIDRMDLMSSTPLYGLNALGGAMTVRMKNGFTYQGFDGEFSGGSFNQRGGEAEYGVNNGVFGLYAAVRILNQDGWRQFAQDHLKQYYVDFSYHPDDMTVDFSYSRANNRLSGQGAAPVQSLAVDRRSVFTGPQNNIDNVDFFTLNAAYNFTKDLAIQGVAYFRNYRQTVANGDDSDYEACDDADLAGQLCDDDTPLFDTNGKPIPDITNGGSTIIGQNDFESIHSQSWGGSLQLTSNAKLFGFGNAFAAGATIDTASTKFISGTWLGEIDSSLTVLPSPYYVDTPEGLDSPATPVNLNTTNKYYGFYVTDTFDITSRLSVTASGRYNIAKVDLTDLRGTLLNGNNRYTHFNPSAGATYKVLPSLTVFGSYSINNRAPTASEIECSDPERPCLLPSSLTADPPNLKQVVAHTGELGVRGHWQDGHGGKLEWNAAVYRTDSENDIYGISTSVSTGFFQNIGATRRQGLETGLTYQADRWSVYAQYSLVEATFRSDLVLNSPANPFQDDDGNITVLRGNHLPLIPQNRVKIGGDVTVLPHWSIGTSLNYIGTQFYRGDESNQNAPLPGYTLVTLRSSYTLGKHFQVFASVQNLFDRRYSNYGLFGDPTGVGAPGVPPAAQLGDAGVDPRFQSPGMPRAYFGGFRVTF